MKQYHSVKALVVLALVVSSSAFGAPLAVPDIVVHEEMPPFSETDRVFKDVSVQLDLSKATAISFDLTCGNLRPFRGFTLHLKCGDGWIRQAVTPEKLSGSVERFTLPMKGFDLNRLSDTNALANVTVIRLSCWRYAGEQTLADVVVRNFEMSDAPQPKKRIVAPIPVEPIPAKSGERRFISCHRAWGCEREPGGRTWDEQIAKLKKAGFTDFKLNVAWSGRMYCKSAVYPEDPVVAKYGDQLELCKAACRKHGLRFHVWKCCWNLGARQGANVCNPAYRARMVREGRLQVDANDLKTGTPHLNALCPNHPDNIREETASMLELAKKGVDGIQFDYVRYYSSETCVCPRCRELFERRLGKTVANWPTDVSTDPALKVAWRQFRCDTITTFVRDVVARIRRECPPVEIFASVVPSSERSRYTVGQDWGVWAREGLLDFVITMGYAPSYSLYRESRVGCVLQEKNPITVYPGIGLAVWPKSDGRNGIRLREQVLALRELGFGGFNVFEWGPETEQYLDVFAGPAPADMRATTLRASSNAVSTER